MVFMKLDVFYAEWTATDCVRLILVFLVSGSQRQLVDEVQGDGPLSNTHFFRFKVWKIVVTGCYKTKQKKINKLTML